MDETERMVTLKKAYAEMILNTSKEAAARVMTAEGKAHKFRQDLLTTKEEALRMLLRLKQMIDAKMGCRRSMLIEHDKKAKVHRGLWRVEGFLWACLDFDHQQIQASWAENSS